MAENQHQGRKRKRTCSNASLPTPPSLDLDTDLTPLANETEENKAGRGNEIDEDGNDDILQTSLHVLQIEAAALADITALYTTSLPAQTSLSKATNAILTAQRNGRRLIVCAVGKSAYIAQKFVATCKSLSISAAFLHACEAVHGDLGDVRTGDVVLFVSYSGRTPELLNLLPHLPEDVRIVALTGQTRAQDCRLLDGLDDQGILLPAPVFETEETSFGVAAPTTSTTVALAVSDMLALTLAEMMHGRLKREMFKRNHPGGAIGMSTLREAKRAKREKEVDVAGLELPSPSISGEDDR